MAAGLVTHNITPATGVTYTINGWVPNTGAPDVGLTPVSMIVDPLTNQLAKAEDSASADGDYGIPSLSIQKATPANTAGTDGDYTMTQMQDGYMWVAGPKLVKVSSNFTRPNDTTAYAANDAVANNVTAGSVTLLSWSIPRGAGTIKQIRIKKSSPASVAMTYRLHLFDVTLTAGAGDNAAFTAPMTDGLFYVDVASLIAGSDVGIGVVGVDRLVATTTVYGLLQTLSAYTPVANEVYTVDLWYQPA